MTTGQREYIIGEYTAGRRNPNRIASHLNISRKSVSEFAYLHGLTKKHRRWTSDDEALIREHWKRGENKEIQRLAMIFGCTTYMVENRIRKMIKEHTL